jgi:lauroyl/myristoyl acyltransferase
LAVLIGRILPRKWGLKLAAPVGTLLGSNKKSPMVKAIRANQWVVHEQSLTNEELDELPKTVFRSAARCTFDYYYYLSRAEKIEAVVDFSPEVNMAFERIRSNEPSVFVCPHLSNFELMGYAFALNNIDVQVLSYPNPNASYKLQNQLRESLGITVTPMSLSAFRQARKRLRAGGSILTGLDRPLAGDLLEKYQPEFFGHKTNLPVTYVRMAKEANAPVIIMAATPQPGNRYCLEGSQPIWMDSADDLETEILHNANKVLTEAEGLIQKYAHSWAMFYPVWPQFLGI